MYVLKGSSLQHSGRAAVDEATADWSASDLSTLGMILVYYSSRQSAEEISRRLAERFPGVPMAGCSTAGEFLNRERLEGSLVVMGICTPRIRWKVGVLTEVSGFTADQVAPLLKALSSGHGKTPDALDPDHHFALLLQDGLSMKEEQVAAAMTVALGEVTLIGGSAGDDLQFRKTTQIANGQSYSDAAIVILGESAIPFTIIKHQHYFPMEQIVVVTDADVSKRTVKTLDSRPAAEVYAELVGVPFSELGEYDFGRSPLILSEHGEYYVRSIQRVGEDGELIFYCAIEEGMLLELGERKQPLDNLKQALGRFTRQLGEVELILLFSCILCKLETDEMDERLQWSQALAEIAPNVIGFDTYGEQLNGMHINQTLVAIGFAKG